MPQQLFEIAERITHIGRRVRVVMLAIQMADAYADGLTSRFPAADACKDVIRALVAGRIPALVAADDGSRAWLLVLALAANTFPGHSGVMVQRFRAELDSSDKQLRMGLLGLLHRMHVASQAERDEFIASEIYAYYKEEAAREDLPEAYVSWNATSEMLGRGLQDAF